MSANIKNANPFLATSQTFSKDYEQYLLQITKRDSDVSRAINQREIGSYTTFEELTGQQWFDQTNPQTTRSGYRKTFFLPAPLGAVASIAHGFTDAQLATFTWTKILGAYTDKTGSPRGASISSEIDVFPSPGSNISFAVPVAFQVTYNTVVILEYLKN